MKKVIYTLVILVIANLSIADWSIVNMGTTNEFTSISLPTSQIFYATAVNNTTYAGTFYKSTNGGASWFQLPFPSNFMAPYVCSISSDGVSGFVAGNQILKTTNGGVNWTTAYTSTDTVVFFGASVGGTPKAFWAVGIKMVGSILYPIVVRCPSYFTSNVYTRVTMPASMVGYQLTSVSTIDSMTCLIGVQRGSQPGLILKTTDKGVNWTTETMPAGIEIWSIDMDNSGGGFAAGGNGGNCYIYRTSNSGTSWYLSYSGSQGRIRGLDYFGYVYAVGLNGTILKSDGGGSTWASQNSGVTTQLKAISHLESNQNIVYAVGENGIMLKTTNGGVSVQNISSEIPSSYSLQQNYPNPFNPTTNLKFQVKSSNVVKLVVFDILGKEVATLVNEKLAPGTYEATFDGSNLTSGVYFYRLTAGDFSETKKMIMIK
jgi:photosystem II stability/assembly factor-like uncharacterized protein